MKLCAIIYMVINVIAHIVPQVYLKSWCNEKNKNSIYIFDSIMLQPELRNLKTLSKTNFQKKDEYMLNIEDCCLEIYSELFEELYSKINNKYYIKYKSREIRSAYEFRNYCRWMTLENQADWIIEDLSTNLRKKYRVFLQEIISIWNLLFREKIEKFFSEQYENQWPNFLQYLDNIKVSGITRKISMSEENRVFLIEYFGIQLTRKYGNFSMFKNIISYYSTLVGIETELDDIIVKKLWLSSIYKFMLYKKSKDERYSNNVVNLMIKLLNSKQITFELLISDTIYFFTSDNPIFRFESNNWNDIDYIYFPISKTLCLRISSEISDNKMLLVKKITKTEVKIINNLIKENSEKHFVCYDMNFQDYII